PSASRNASGCSARARSPASLNVSIGVRTSASVKRRQKSPAVVGSGSRSAPRASRDASSRRRLAVLKQLGRHIPGPMTVVWDRSNIHDRSKAVRAYLARHPEIETEPLPGYVPEANPDESVWGHAKHGRLANLAPEDTAELRAELIAELRRSQRSPG